MFIVHLIGDPLPINSSGVKKFRHLMSLVTRRHQDFIFLKNNIWDGKRMKKKRKKA